MAILSDDQQEFFSQVDHDIRDTASPQIHDALRHPKNLERWILALKKMKRDTESQLTADKATRSEARAKFLETGDRDGWLKFLSKRDRWRADAIRFKNGAETKLDEATVLRYSTVNTLLDAIEKHRDSISSHDAMPEDETLWTVLDD